MSSCGQEKSDTGKYIMRPVTLFLLHDAATGKILDVNQGMLDMYGYTYEEALLVDIGSLSCGEAPFTIEEAGRKIQNTVLHGPQSFEWMARKKRRHSFLVGGGP